MHKLNNRFLAIALAVLIALSSSIVSPVIVIAETFEPDTVYITLSSNIGGDIPIDHVDINIYLDVNPGIWVGDLTLAADLSTVITVTGGWTPGPAFAGYELLTLVPGGSSFNVDLVSTDFDTPPTATGLLGTLRFYLPESINEVTFTLTQHNELTGGLFGPDLYLNVAPYTWTRPPTAITNLAIEGITAPTFNAAPVTTNPTGGGDQWTATIAWFNNATNNPAGATFAASTVYRAEITIEPLTIYTMTGVANPGFTLPSLTTTSITRSGNVVTAVFPATPAIPTFPINITNGGTGATATPNPAEEGETVTLNAGTHPEGRPFINWTSTDVTINDATVANAAYFTMPANAVTVTANWGDIPQTGISLSTSGNHSFGTVVEGYSPITAHSVTVTSTGNQPTGQLDVALSGTNAASFSLAGTDLTGGGQAGTIASLANNSDTAVFTVVPNNGLAPATYNATVTVSGSDLPVPQSFTVSFIVEAPVYDISLTPNNIVMPALLIGNSVSEAVNREQAVTITNTGNQPTGQLNISGYDDIGDYDESFIVTPVTIPSIANTSGTATFSIFPSPAMLASTTPAALSATLRITGDGGIDEVLPVSFVRTDEQIADFSLSVADTHVFPAADVGYGPISPLNVQIDSIGNIPTGAISIAFTAGSGFSLSDTSLPSIPAGGHDSFTVGPNTGLAAGTHTATVTVTAAGADDPVSFQLSFTVNEEAGPGDILPASVSIAPSGNFELTVAGTRQLSAAVLPANATNQNVTWQSSNPAVATVSSNGLVTAVSQGTANITVTTVVGGYSAYVEVTVTPAGGNGGNGNNGGGIRPNRRPGAGSPPRVQRPAAEDTNQVAEAPADPVTPPTAPATQNVNLVVIADLPDGIYAVSIEGLPEGVDVPAYVEVVDGEFAIEFLLPEGEYNIYFSLYDEDGNAVFTSDTVNVVSEAPEPVTAPEPPVQQPVAAPTVVRLAIGDASYTVNGMAVAGEIAPFIDPATNRTMVPLRLIAEALGAQVGWIEETRTVTIAANGRFLSLELDTPLPGDMGTAMIVNDRTFVPVAYVAEMLGATVRWDGDARAVYVIG